LRDLTGYYTGAEKTVGPDYRLGLLRAMGPFEHPILLGATSMTGCLCLTAIPFRGKSFALAGCIVGLCVSISSAPLQALIAGLGLLIYNRLFAKFAWRWYLVLFGLCTFVGGVFAFLASPMGVINQYLLFDPTSGYSREYEWQTVGIYVMSSPWVGIGFGWEEIARRIDAFVSIDSVWLGKALIYGIPCPVLIGLSYVGTILPAAGPNIRLSSAEVKLRNVLSILMCLYLFLGFTVYFWGSFWILTALLAGVNAHLGELARSDMQDELEGDNLQGP
jgi:hypothetical protein